MATGHEYQKAHTEKQLFDPLPEAELAKHNNLSSYILFVEGLLGAEASLETSLENPAAW